MSARQYRIYIWIGVTDGWAEAVKFLVWLALVGLLEYTDDQSDCPF